VWSAGSNGNVKPAATIAGSATQLNAPAGIAFGIGGNIFVTNGIGSVTVYARNARGNAAPLRTIAGSATGLALPRAIAFDASGKRFYVANARAGGSITAYGVNATGNSAPAMKIAGAKTGLNSPSGVAIDAAGYVYVSNLPQNGNGFVTVYAPGSNGNVAPVQRIAGNKVDVRSTIAVR
jgi:DNA-binding beta-propeller fold protein YncE